MLSGVATIRVRRPSGWEVGLMLRLAAMTLRVYAHASAASDRAVAYSVGAAPEGDS